MLTDYVVQANATGYFISFQSDTAVGTVVLNYTVSINLNVVGTPFAFFLTLTRSPITESIFGFENLLRTRDYFFPMSPPSDYNDDNSMIASFSESIFIRGSFPDSLFSQGAATTMVDFTIFTVVVGSNSEENFEDNAVVQATVNRPPSKYFDHSEVALYYMCMSIPTLNM